MSISNALSSSSDNLPAMVFLLEFMNASINLLAVPFAQSVVGKCSFLWKSAFPLVQHHTAKCSVLSANYIYSLSIYTVKTQYDNGRFMLEPGFEEP